MFSYKKYIEELLVNGERTNIVKFLVSLFNGKTRLNKYLSPS